MPFQDDNIDDIFRRAAENFVLKEPDSQWNSIGARLNKPEVPVVKTDRRRQIILFSLVAILLIHLPFRLYETFYHDEISIKKMVSGKYSDPAEKIYDKREKELNMLNNKNMQVSHENNYKRSAVLTAGTKQKISSAKSQLFEMNQDSKEAVSLSADELIYTATLKNLNQIESKKNQLKDITPRTIKIKAVDTNVLPEPVEPLVAENPTKKKAMGLYAGIHTGISMSLVKGQHLSSPGFTGGLALGYKLSPSLSVETGFKISEKKYYSSGKHFKPKDPDPNMPTDMAVVSLNSKTFLYEIPIRAKFDFNKKAKSQFFLAGGISTFIVGNEVNDYIIYRNGINSSMHATYNKNKSYLVAAIDVSIGYEKLFKNKQTLRIEPWMQFARKGIGVGQLPVSGFGLQVGYFFHK